MSPFRPPRARVAWAVWFILVIAVVRPWHGYVGHAHWGRVEWIPLSRGPFIADIFANVMLFVPLGALQASAFPATRPSLTVGSVAVTTFVMSSSFELSQVFSHTRLPSTTDIASNVGGAVCGAVLVCRLVKRGP